MWLKALKIRKEGFQLWLLPFRDFIKEIDLLKTMIQIAYLYGLIIDGLRRIITSTLDHHLTSNSWVPSRSMVVRLKSLPMPTQTTIPSFRDGTTSIYILEVKYCVGSLTTGMYDTCNLITK